MLKVYLAGPMTGLTLEEAEGWRKRAAEVLEAPRGPLGYLAAFFTCFSPLRGKEFLRYAGEMTSAGPAKAGGDRGIYRRDKWDVERADVVLANFTGARTVSIGTMFELAWAAQAGKYIVVVMEPGNLHDHAFVRQAASAVFGDLDAALAYMTKTLCKTGGGT